MKRWLLGTRELEPYWRIAIVLLSLTAIALLLGYDSILIGSPAFTNGRTAYQEIAGTLVQHGVYGYDPSAPSAFRPPLYPLFLAVHVLVLGPFWALGAKLSQALLLIVTGLLVVRVLARLSNDGRVMVIGAALYAGLLPLHAQVLDKNELVLFVLLLAVLANSLVATDRRVRGIALLGVVSGLTHLTRPSGVLIAGAVVVALLYEARQQEIAKRVRNVAVYLVVFCVTLLPWQIRNHREFGVWTMASSSTTGLNLLKGNNPTFTRHFPFLHPDHFDRYLADDLGIFLGNTQQKVEFVDEPRIEQVALDNMRAAPAHTLGWVAVKAAAFVSPLSIPLGTAQIRREDEQLVIEDYRPVNLASQAIYALYTCLAYLGIAAAIRNWTQHSKAQRTVYLFMATFAALLVAAHAVSYPLTRYRLPLDLLLLIPSALLLRARLPWPRIHEA